MVKNCVVKIIFLFFVLAVFSLLNAAEAGVTIILEEDFKDLSLPKWTKSWQEGAEDVIVSSAKGPEGKPAISIERKTPGNAQASFPVPVEEIAGKSVVLDLWIKADNIITGEMHYYNAKSMLIWEEDGKKNVNPGTRYTDFSGTFDWQRRIYVVKFPENLKSVSLTIGLQGCTGNASYSNLSLRIDPSLPNQEAVERLLKEEERKRTEKLKEDIEKVDLQIKISPDGYVNVFAGEINVPRKYWNERIRKKLLETPVPSLPDAKNFNQSLAKAMLKKQEELRQELLQIKEPAINDRVYEIVSLIAKAGRLAKSDVNLKPILIEPTGKSSVQVNPLVFGNNINWGNGYADIYDTSTGQLTKEFLGLIRPMGITFLRYPGGCNSDVFNWRESVGPLKDRARQINFYGNDWGPVVFGVDEYLRFCEQENMTPIITVAFLWDNPENIMTHPRENKKKWIKDYLKKAPERIKLAADWVEYCNGSVDTPMGKLRAQNGHPKPYNVKFWEIGNETYGPDPVGSCSAEEYAREFLKYVQAMKKVDPNVKIGLNGAWHQPGEWDETILKNAGKDADFVQQHFYCGIPGSPESAIENFTRPMRHPGNRWPDALSKLESQMNLNPGRTLPVIVTEYGVAGSGDSAKDMITSITSAILIADMVRVWLENPIIYGANHWCLYSGYYFSPVNGPSLGKKDLPYWIRPSYYTFLIYANLRSDKRMPVRTTDEAVSAVVFEQQNSYGIVLINRDAVNSNYVSLKIPGLKSGKARGWVLCAGHPLFGNEDDHNLIKALELQWNYDTKENFYLPPNSVTGLLLPK